MSAKRKTTAAPELVPATGQSGSPKETPAQSASKLVQTIRQDAKDTLEGHFDDYLEGASPEEIRIMTQVMTNWNQYSHGYKYGHVDSPDEYEVPILTAFQEMIGKYEECVVVIPKRDMLSDVERCIFELEHMSYNREQRKKAEAAVDPKVRQRRVLDDDFSVFVEKAGDNSVSLMIDIISRFVDLKRDPAITVAVDDNKIKNVLAVAVEIEMERYRVNAAVKSATAA